MSFLNVGKSLRVTVPTIGSGPLGTKNVEEKTFDFRNGVYSVEPEARIMKNWFP